MGRQGLMDDTGYDFEPTIGEEIAYEAGYDQGRADREKEVLCYLVDNGYIKYGFSAEYLEEQMKGAE